MKTLSRRKKRRIRKGDFVRVRSEKEIRATLDRNNKCKGLEFMQAMWRYCGQTHRVIRKLGRIVVDEERLVIGKCKRDIFILEGLFCQGDGGEYKDCDRNCSLLWRSEWLENEGSDCTRQS